MVFFEEEVLIWL